MARKKRTDPSGNPYIDGLIYGTQWDANILTYSFPTIKSAYGDPKNIFLQSDANNNWTSLEEAPSCRSTWRCNRRPRAFWRSSPPSRISPSTSWTARSRRC